MRKQVRVGARENENEIENGNGNRNEYCSSPLSPPEDNRDPQKSICTVVSKSLNTDR